MKYVFDTNTLSAIFKHYYFDSFPTFWSKFDQKIISNEVCSVREVLNEIKGFKRGDILEDWIKDKKDFFQEPSIAELKFITEIYTVNHFKFNLEKIKLLKGGAFADPFIIAKAKTENATVVTEEKNKENAAKIPNICSHFNIQYTNLNGFLKLENWIF
ncbi:MAG: DUF4411 family protein [Bacteroidales bacterium]|nr:DUF4411 family protein [Bacteroidales bacterium]